jgi:hypothetical protein
VNRARDKVLKEKANEDFGLKLRKQLRENEMRDTTDGNLDAKLAAIVEETVSKSHTRQLSVVALLSVYIFSL